MSWRATSLRRAASAEADSGPRYSYSPGLVWSVATSLLLGRRRSLAADARRLVAGAVPGPRVENAHWIPPAGPFVVVTNHYYKPGYNAWWGIALTTAAIAGARSAGDEITWLMTNRWTYRDWPRSHVVTPMTYLLFTRLARTYDLVPMPPMPPQPQYVDEGARAVRRVLSLLSASSDGTRLILGIAPEGRDSADGSLIEPPPGTGRLLLHIARHGLRMLPVGVAEVDGVLTARFGPPFELRVACSQGRVLDRKELDRLASAQVMAAIGAQLPPALWGAFRAEIEQARL